jgi:hypothetical protein
MDGNNFVTDSLQEFSSYAFDRTLILFISGLIRTVSTEATTVGDFTDHKLGLTTQSNAEHG